MELSELRKPLAHPEDRDQSANKAGETVPFRNPLHALLVASTQASAVEKEKSPVSGVLCVMDSPAAVFNCPGVLFC
jgi:hypothetical protein